MTPCVLGAKSHHLTVRPQRNLDTLKRSWSSIPDVPRRVYSITEICTKSPFLCLQLSASNGVGDGFLSLSKIQDHSFDLSSFSSLFRTRGPCFLRLELVGRLALGLARALLDEGVLAGRQRRRLAVVDALQPVSEAGAAEGVGWVGPEGGPVEEGAHLDADLPESHGDA
jgi:hypothetical protein